MSPALPLVSGAQVIAALAKVGFVEVSQRGSHVKLRGRDGRLGRRQPQLLAPAAAILMSAESFETLTPEQQDALLTAGADAFGAAMETSRTEDLTPAAQLCEAPIEVVESSEAQLAEFAAALEPVYDDLASDPPTRAYLDEIRAIKDELGAPRAHLSVLSDAVGLRAGTPPPTRTTTARNSPFRRHDTGDVATRATSGERTTLTHPRRAQSRRPRRRTPPASGSAAGSRPPSSARLGGIDRRTLWRGRPADCRDPGRRPRTRSVTSHAEALTTATSGRGLGSAGELTVRARQRSQRSLHVVV